MVVVDLSRESIKLAVAESACQAVRFQQITAITPPLEGEPDHPADDATLAALIRNEINQKGWTGMRAACLLSAASTSTQSLVLPPMPDDELRQAIELKLEETLHFSLEDACYDYRVVDEVVVDGNSQLLVRVAAAPRATVLSALELLRDTGLEPVAVSVAAESLANLAHHARLCGEGKNTIHVDVGNVSTVVNLFQDRVLRFSREFETSSRSFTRALMRPILTDDGPVQLRRAQAKEVKWAAGLPRDDEDIVWPHGMRSGQILPLLEPVVQRLFTEIDRSVEYMRTLLGDDTIDRIVLSGPASRMRNLGPTLSEHLGLPVALIDPVERACAHWHLSIREPGKADTSLFSAILGYAGGDLRPLNLLPREERIRLVVEKVAHSRRVVAPFLLGGAAAVTLASLPILGHYGQARESMAWALSEVETRLEASASYAERTAHAQRGSKAVREAQGPGGYWRGLLQELSQDLPAAVQLTSLEAEQDGDGMNLTLEAVVHGGREPFEVTMTELTMTLNESPFLTSAQIVNAGAASETQDGYLELDLVLRDPRGDDWGSEP